MMIPLRRALIVQQHGMLKYPEGTACAEVLKAGATPEERAMGRGEPARRPATTRRPARRPSSAASASGVIYKLAMEAFKLWKDTPHEGVRRAARRPDRCRAEISPELLGVGYIIGPRIAATMAAGGVLAYLVLIPMIRFFGAATPGVLAPGTAPIAGMGPDDIRGAYVLYIGAGRGRDGRHHQPVPLPADDRRAASAAGSRDWRAGARRGRASAETRAHRPRPVAARRGASGLVVLMAGILLARSLHMNLLGAAADRGVRLPVRHRVVAPDRRDRLVVQPDLAG